MDMCSCSLLEPFVEKRTNELSLPDVAHLQASWESADEVKIFTDYKAHMNPRSQSWPPGPRPSCGLSVRRASTQ